MQDERAIRQLVRQTLGCTCPETVFEYIEQTYRERPTRAHPYRVRLVIGRRLLIYLLDRASVETMHILLADILIAGRHDRDAHGYNRFRAVLGDTSDAMKQAALQSEWEQLAAGDDRSHLHLVGPDDIAFILADAQASGCKAPQAGDSVDPPANKH